MSTREQHNLRGVSADKGAETPCPQPKAERF
jgi:hypothetical protein